MLKKISEQVAVRAGKGFTFISNEVMYDII